MPPGINDRLLLEDGTSYLLQEDGTSFILLEFSIPEGGAGEDDSAGASMSAGRGPRVSVMRGRKPWPWEKRKKPPFGG